MNANTTVTEPTAAASTEPTEPTETATGRRRVVRAVVWLPGLVVALGAAVVTAHGLYEAAAGYRTGSCSTM